MPPNNLRSLVARRYFSRYSHRRRRSRSVIVVSEAPRVIVERFLIRGAGVTLGCGFGYYLHGDSVSKLEEERQRLMKSPLSALWEKLQPGPEERMWRGRREKMLSDSQEKMWPGRREKMLSDSQEKTWSDLWGCVERMWFDLREKIWSDRKS